MRLRLGFVLALCPMLVAFALVPTAVSSAAVVPRAGLYKGKSVQNHPVRFRMRNGSITGDIVFTVTGSAGCSLTVHYTFSKAKVAPDGTFKLKTGGMTVTGKFVTATSVRGTLSAPSCGSAPRSVAYTAKRVA